MLCEEHVMQNTSRLSKPSSIIATIINLFIFCFHVLKWNVTWGCPCRKTCAFFHLPNVWVNKNVWKDICLKKYNHICLILTSFEGTCAKTISETDVVIVIGYISQLISKSVEIFLQRQFSLVKSDSIHYLLKCIKRSLIKINIWNTALGKSGVLVYFFWGWVTLFYSNAIISILWILKQLLWLTYWIMRSNV